MALGTILGPSCGISEPSWDQKCVFFLTFSNTFCEFVFSPQKRFRRHLGAEFAPTWVVESGQERPKSGQETLKRSPRAPQSGPRATQERPRAAQEWPGSGQERPKSGQERPKSGQERPQSGQERPKTGPRTAKSGPGAAKSGPRAAKSGTICSFCLLQVFVKITFQKANKSNKYAPSGLDTGKCCATPLSGHSWSGFSHVGASRAAKSGVRAAKGDPRAA